MKKISYVIVCAFFSAGILADVTKVIYGNDNRQDVFEYKSPEVVRLSRSTVALVKSNKFTFSGNQFVIDDTDFKTKMNLCSGERFAEQPAAAFCSGFLVAPNRIVTAGHCITSASDCEDVRFVFDYKMISKTRAQKTFVSSQIFACKKVLGWKKENAGLDFALIELDRDVTDREPLNLSSNSGLKQKTDLLVIGHPSGLPTKITDDANVRNVLSSAGYFTANLDTYGGNSGSAVFNAKTLKVEGILVRGEKDFLEDPLTECRSSYKIRNNEGRGEDVTLISLVQENDGLEETTDNSSSNTNSIRFVWLDSDSTCNEFHENDFIREVPASYCGPEVSDLRYVWLTVDNTCNEFRGNIYIREVSDSLCGNVAITNMRYVWLNSDQSCNLFDGLDFVREVANSFCQQN